MIYITAQEGTTIPLGRQGENEVLTIEFDVGEWLQKYGDGDFSLLHERCMDSAPYVCPTMFDEEAQKIKWVISSSDTAYDGRGQAQLVYVVDNAVAKSVVFTTNTLPSLDGEMDYPDPYENWLKEMHEDAEYVREHYEGALGAQENAEAWAVGKRSGENVSEDDATYHNNSKYYSEQSAASADESSDSAEAAALSATQAAAFVGSPMTATAKANMTDKTKVYVYIGSESGMSNGHWYYWNGTAWADGGVYNATAVDIATSADLQEALYS